MMQKFTTIILSAAIMFSFGSTCPAEQSGVKKFLNKFSGESKQVLPVEADTWVYAFRPDKNYGDGGGWADITNPNMSVTLPKMFLGFGGTDIKIVLLKFDTKDMKKHAVIKKAVAKVYNDYAGSDAAQKIDAKMITSEWKENTITFNTRPSLDDRVLSTVTIKGAIGNKQPGRWIEFDVTAAVQHWQKGGANFGIALVPQGDHGVDFDLVAKEYKAKASYAPKLEIEYK